MTFVNNEEFFKQNENSVSYFEDDIFQSRPNPFSSFSIENEILSANLEEKFEASSFSKHTYQTADSGKIFWLMFSP